MENIKSAYKNNNLKHLFQLGMMNFICLMNHISVSNIQGYFEYIIKKHETIANNSPVQIYMNRIENRIAFKIKTGYKLELLPPETMELLGSTKKDINQDKYGEYVPKLEPAEVVLVHCNLVNNNYQQASKVLFTFAPVQLIDIPRHSLTMLNTTDLKYGLLIKILIKIMFRSPY